MKLCPGCGTQLEDRAKFCMECGRPVYYSVSVHTKKEFFDPEPAALEAEPAQPAAPVRNRKKKREVWMAAGVIGGLLVSVLTLVLVGCLALGGLFRTTYRDAGRWTLSYTESENPQQVMDEKMVNFLRTMGMEFYLELNGDGSGQLVLDQKANISWRDGTVRLPDGSLLHYIHQDGYLVLTMETVTLYFIPDR